MKKLLSLVLAIVLLAGMAVPASAANESPERDDSALTFAEARQKGIPYDKPIDQKNKRGNASGRTAVLWRNRSA